MMVKQTAGPGSVATRGLGSRLRLAALRALGAVLRLGAAPLPTRATPRRILLIRPDHLGDVLFTTPAIARLRVELPDSEIWYLCGPWSEPLVRSNPNLNGVLVCDFPWFNRRPRRWPWGPYFTLWREAVRLRRLGFDTAVILRFDFWWGAALTALAGIPRRVGYGVAECLPFLTEPVRYVAGRHEVLQNLTLCRVVVAGGTVDGGKRSQPGPGTGDEVATRWGSAQALEFRVTAAEENRAKALLGELPADHGPLIAIHPGAGAPIKLWPAERWAALADALVRRWGAAIVLTGSTAEHSLTRAIAQHMRRPALDLSGQTSLGELAAVLALCDLALGVDSGPMHLAVAVDVPSVHLFGPVSPAVFGPWGDPARHVVIQAKYEEAICHGGPCNRLDFESGELAAHHCMASISLEAVLAAADGLLSRRALSGRGAGSGEAEALLGS